MRARVNKKDFLVVLGHALSIVDKRPAIPILSHVLLDFEEGRISLRATDLDHSIFDAVDAHVDAYGRVAVPAQTFYDIIKKSHEESEIELSFVDNGNRMMITNGNAKFEVVVANGQEFPMVTRVGHESGFSLDGDELRRVIDRTKFSMSIDESRHVLNSLYFHCADDGFKAVATDSHRLAVAKINLLSSDNLHSFLLSRKTVTELRKLLDGFDEVVHVALSESQVEFEIGRKLFVAKVIEGRFPEYTAAIPMLDGRSFIVDRRKFIAVIDRVAVISDDKARRVRLDVDAGKLCASAVSIGFGSGQDEITIEYDGDRWSSGFNARYLLDVAEALQGERLRIVINDSPMLIMDPGELESLYVVMHLHM